MDSSRTVRIFLNSILWLLLLGLVGVQHLRSLGRVWCSNCRTVGRHTLLFLACATKLNVAGAQPALVPDKVVPQSAGKLKVRLTYQPSAPLRGNSEKVIGFYQNSETNKSVGAFTPDREIDPSEGPGIYRGTTLATDRQGALYFYDPISTAPRSRTSVAAIRVFNPAGREIQRWVLPPNTRALRAAVTWSGIVWVSVEKYGVPPAPESAPTLPILAYQPGRSKPIVNWMQKLPSGITTPILTKCNLADLDQSQKRSFFSTSDLILRSSGKKVRFEMYGLGSAAGMEGRNIGVDVSEVGNYLGTSVSKSSWKMDSPLLALTGAEYKVEWDSTPERPVWTRMWIWNTQAKKGAPLLNRDAMSTSQSWWSKALGLDRKYFRALFQNADKDYIYLVLSCPGEQKEAAFSVRGNSPINLGAARDYAAVILDQKRRIRSIVSWKSTYLGTEDEWIFPIPGQRGFYRQEFGKGELRVYFHPSAV